MEISFFCSSSALFNITNSLLESERPISFRELARRAKCGIRSAQLALAKLEQGKCVVKTKSKNRIFYKLKDLAVFKGLKVLIHEKKRAELKNRAEKYSKSAAAVLQQMSELTNFALALKRLNPTE